MTAAEAATSTDSATDLVMSFKEDCELASSTARLLKPPLNHLVHVERSGMENFSEDLLCLVAY
jgi:hypothetical protein